MSAFDSLFVCLRCIYLQHRGMVLGSVQQRHCTQCRGVTGDDYDDDIAGRGKVQVLLTETRSSGLVRRDGLETRESHGTDVDSGGCVTCRRLWGSRSDTLHHSHLHERVVQQQVQYLDHRQYASSEQQTEHSAKVACATFTHAWQVKSVTSSWKLLGPCHIGKFSLESAWQGLSKENFRKFAHWKWQTTATVYTKIALNQ